MDKEKIIQLYNEGYSLNRLSIITGCSKLEIRELLKSSGISIRQIEAANKARIKQTNRELEMEDRDGIINKGSKGR